MGRHRPKRSFGELRSQTGVWQRGEETLGYCLLSTTRMPPANSTDTILRSPNAQSVLIGRSNLRNAETLRMVVIGGAVASPSPAENRAMLHGVNFSRPSSSILKVSA